MWKYLGQCATVIFFIGSLLACYRFRCALPLLRFPRIFLLPLLLPRLWLYLVHLHAYTHTYVLAYMGSKGDDTVFVAWVRALRVTHSVFACSYRCRWIESVYGNSHCCQYTCSSVCVCVYVSEVFILRLPSSPAQCFFFLGFLLIHFFLSIFLFFCSRRNRQTHKTHAYKHTTAAATITHTHKHKHTDIIGL